jgi:hypothetical protein
LLANEQLPRGKKSDKRTAGMHDADLGYRHLKGRTEIPVVVMKPTH